MSKTYCKCGAKLHKKHFPGCHRRKETKGAIPLPTPPVTKHNNLVLVLDTSASMAVHGQYPKRVLREQIVAARKAAYDNHMISHLRIVEFDSTVRVVVDTNLNAIEVDDYLDRRYHAEGDATDIYSGFLMGANSDTLGVPHLLTFITDGQHNHGDRSIEFLNRLRALQATDRWTFNFIGPNGVVQQMVGRGVPAGNCQTWDGTTEQFREISTSTARAIGTRYANVAKGINFTASLYADAEIKNTRDVNKLQTITGFTQHLVDKKTDITSFVEKLKGHYRPGEALYELTKPEKIQYYKSLILQDRKSGDLLGGPLVRKTIGIPDGKDAKVSPGNLKGYTVFVESTSTNRNLVPGTRVLVKN